MLRPVGMGVVAPSLMSGIAFMRFGLIWKRSDCPLTVTPFVTQVARARTVPNPAGTFGKTQEPSAFTETLRLRMLTTQLSFNCCAPAGMQMADRASMVRAVATAFLEIV